MAHHATQKKTNPVRYCVHCVFRVSNHSRPPLRSQQRESGVQLQWRKRFNPSAGLLLGAAGNLYGTLYWGGSVSDCGFTGCGTVFEVLHAPSDQWTAKVLYRFHNDGFDGKEPFAGLISDAAGNLYGTTLDGGPVSCSNQLGCGTVFKLTRHANGKWTKKQLHNFGKGTDGSSPFGGLIFDAAGNLYGTTFSGGTYGLGTVFQLRRCRNGKWIEKVLYSFKGEDGNGPRAGLISDTAGNLIRHDRLRRFRHGLRRLRLRNRLPTEARREGHLDREGAALLQGRGRKLALCWLDLRR